MPTSPLTCPSAHPPASGTESHAAEAPQCSLRVDAALHAGDALRLRIAVSRIDAEGTAQLRCELDREDGAALAHPADTAARVTGSGPASASASVSTTDIDPRLHRLLALGEGLAPVRCGVVHPCDAASLTGALQAAALGLIVPILIGPEARIRDIARREGLPLDGITLIPTPHSHASASAGAELAASAQVDTLMKGSLHTDELIHAVLATPGLRTGRRMSHVFRFDIPSYDKPLLITDAALNIAPTLSDKVDIVQNAVDFSRLLGVTMPRVAILAAVETVTPAMVATVDAAALCKMAERGQLRGAVVDGPLAFDNAISAQAAARKGIVSPVAGRADILVVPDLESGNMLAKQLDYFAGAMSAGIVLGAKVPIALTSRADGATARIGSALLAKLAARRPAAWPPAA